MPGWLRDSIYGEDDEETTRRLDPTPHDPQGSDPDKSVPCGRPRLCTQCGRLHSGVCPKW